jgi:phosphoribosylformylglycinamidine synthase subunit PurSL
LGDLLASLDICSKEYKSRQYDGEVKGLSVVKPYIGVNCDVPADGAVMRVEYGSNAGIVLAEGINPFYSDLDTYHMTAAVIDEAVRRTVSAGARFDRIAGLDNFCWPDPAQSAKTPDGRYKLAQLVRANKALYDVTTAYGVPCISGKDSCKNDSTRGGKKISIPPTLLFSTLAKIDDVRKAVTLDFKRPGDLIYVLGATRDELGASAYYRLLSGEQGHINRYGGNVPRLDPAVGKQMCKTVEKAIRSGIISSCHAPAKGGLAIGFAFCALGGNLGAEIGLDAIIREANLDDDAILFSESNSRFIVTVAKARKNKFERLLRGMAFACVGSVIAGNKLVVKGTQGNSIISIELERLRDSFKKTLYGI